MDAIHFITIRVGRHVYEYNKTCDKFRVDHGHDYYVSETDGELEGDVINSFFPLVRFAAVCIEHVRWSIIDYPYREIKSSLGSANQRETLLTLDPKLERWWYSIRLLLNDLHPRLPVDVVAIIVADVFCLPNVTPSLYYVIKQIASETYTVDTNTNTDSPTGRPAKRAKLNRDASETIAQYCE